MAHLALADQPGHRAHRVLDRRVGVDAVLIVEVDRLDAEPSQARLAGGADVIRAPAHALEGAVLAANVAELGGENHRVAAIADRTPDQLLVTAYPVHVGGVQKRHAEIDRALNGRDRLGFVGLPIEFGHAHATEAQRRYAQPVAQLSLLKHQLSPVVRSCRLASRR